MKRILAILASIVIAGCADTSNQEKKPQPLPKETPGRYQSEGGDYPVGAIPNGSLHDAQRNKDVDLVIEYPSRGEGPFPVIVFAPDAGASNKNYVGLTEYWAGHGYVCIKPAHADDVTFLLDSFNALEERYPELKGRLDRNRIGVAGHGSGANVAMQLAVRDPRVKAIVAMAPQGGELSVKIPAMFMTGNEDHDARIAFDHSPATGDKYVVSIAGANRLAFLGGFTLPTAQDERLDRADQIVGQYNPGATAPRSRGENRIVQQKGIIDTIKIAAAAFWDAYLKDAPAAKEYLDTKLSGRGGVTLLKK